MGRLKNEMAQLVKQKNEVLDGLGNARLKVEGRWAKAAQDVRRATLLKETRKENVALILAPTIERRLLFSFAVGGGFEHFRACARGFSSVEASFNTLPVLHYCGGVSKRLEELRSCLRKNVKAEDAFLGVETDRYLFMVGRNSAAVTCFRQG